MTAIERTPVPTVAGTRAVLLGAATVIEQVGWTQHQRQCLTGAVDVLRAIEIASDGDQAAAVIARFEVERVLLTDLATWNDRDNQMADDVTRVLRNLARLLTAHVEEAA